MPTLNAMAGRVLPDRVWNAIKSVAGYRLFYRQTSTLSSGVSLRVKDHPDWTVFTEIFVDGAYDGPIGDALRDAETDLTVLDLGANAGFFTLRLIDRLRRFRPDLSARVLAVEAGDRPAAKFAARVLAENGLCEAVTLVQGLVGKRAGSAVFAQYPATTNNTVHHPNLAAGPVDYVDLGPLLDAGAPVDLIKCDIEGSEFDFLSSYPDLLARTRRVVIELHHAFVDADACDALLRQAGLVRQTSAPSGDCRVDYWERPPTPTL